VPRTNPFGSGTGRYRQPVDETKGRSDEAADEAGRNHPVRDLRPVTDVRREVNDVEDQCHREEAQGEDDEHLVNRMSKKFGSAFHTPLLPRSGASRGPNLARRRLDVTSGGLATLL
jgi:hypothetical protein